MNCRSIKDVWKGWDSLTEFFFQQSSAKLVHTLKRYNQQPHYPSIAGRGISPPEPQPVFQTLLAGIRKERLRISQEFRLWIKVGGGWEFSEAIRGTAVQLSLLRADRHKPLQGRGLMAPLCSPTRAPTSELSSHSRRKEEPAEAAHHHRPQLTFSQTASLRDPSRAGVIAQW